MKEKELFFKISVKEIQRFTLLLQQGFQVEAKNGISIKELFCEQLGISKNYFASGIQTIFLNGMSVDKPEDTPITNKSTISISGPMPGLAGATLRRGGFYAPMRKAITMKPSDNKHDGTKGIVTIKLFNMPLKELGPKFLKKGVYLTKEIILKFVKYQDSELKDLIHEIILDNEPISLYELKRMLMRQERVFFKLTI